MKARLRNMAVFATFLFAAGAPALASQPLATEREIAHLLNYVASPGCQFNRNGTWYEGSKAREHLKDKYDYMAKRKLVSNAESFIERAASSSSMSGKAYLVRCGSGAATHSGPWLMAELKRFRSAAAAR
ncbi:DUF5329 domain-containing protein [Pseudoduganella sp. GCM10020061]|uniref:DUF5329 domain-containing protein n=1 Tax=Pseudoduganella sp. GCM10020061 TaxID=3317345 RepID=UPI00362F50CC